MRHARLLSILAVTLHVPALAWAAGSGMPWESLISQVVNSITGPVAQGAGVVAIVGFGLAMAFGGSDGAMRKGIGIIFGLGIAFTASSFFLSFFGFAGGVLVP